MKPDPTDRFLAVSSLIFGVVFASAIATLAWLCFAHLPLLVALLMFPLVGIVGAMALGPFLAAGAYAVGATLVGLTAIYRKLAASRRRGA